MQHMGVSAFPSRAAPHAPGCSGGGCSDVAPAAAASLQPSLPSPRPLRGARRLASCRHHASLSASLKGGRVQGKNVTRIVQEEMPRWDGARSRLYVRSHVPRCPTGVCMPWW